MPYKPDTLTLRVNEIGNELREPARAAELYYDRLYRVAYALCGDYHHAEDLTQETFTAAFKAASSFRGESSIFTWLVAICRRQWAYRRRGERRFKTLENVEPEAANGALPDDSREVLQAALGKLEESDRTVLVLFHLENFSYQQISQALDWPLGTVKRRLFEARRKLRHLIDGNHAV
jgi:RNA polymerase sigma-70 factor (ECF subfamily)